MELSNQDAVTLWAMRQLLRASEMSGANDRHEVEAELQSRMYDAQASKVALGSDMYLTMADRTTWEYDAGGVNRLREFLVGGGLVSEDEWNRAVKWTPKVDGRVVNTWLKLGGAVVEMVNQARVGRSGRTDLSGPELKELQDKRPDVVAEAAGLLPGGE